MAAAAFMLAVSFTSCKDMGAPNDLSCNPSPLTVVGNKINAEISATFPEKYFKKKATMVVKPVLKYADREAIGDSLVYIGEKVTENGKQVSYKYGGKMSMDASFDYEPEMNKCELFVRCKVKIGKKEYAIPDIKVADGLIATAKLASANADELTPAVTPDKFQRIIQEMQEADIKFLINQASLRSSETRSKTVKAFTEAIKEANANEKKAVKSLEIAGYASPDGSEELNANLAEKRQKASSNYISKQLKRQKIDLEIASKFTAEDWEGFQKLMESSNIQDKELILRVLSMYSDPEQREREIKNLAVAYKSIAEEILPALRRSRMQLTIDLIGKSDAEIIELFKTDAKQLTVEELLFAATLVNTPNDKMSVYNKAIEIYPADYRAYNNLGLLYYQADNLNEAVRLFNKALEIAPANPDVNFNAGVAAMAQGDLDKAEVLLGKAAGTTSNLGNALGTLYLMKGNYAKAQAAFSKVPSNNAALQQILNEDYNGARNTLAAVANPNATTAYLQAVIGARTNDRNAVYNNLKIAIAKNANLKAKAAKDIEFSKFAEDTEFQAIIK